MVFRDIIPYLFISVYMVTDLANASMSSFHAASSHLLRYEALIQADKDIGTPSGPSDTKWQKTVCRHQATALAYMGVYLDFLYLFYR